ncbi:hypothetical protein [Micromonospora sp. WMMD812]|uniref:hypothetical protein n=1 Tax=Micromonospora sp. WMMD812 TaxID=3015152 RepID=UPI00248B19A0|nr:hypothetical protein [Micromonospora sp. WMMD812]WBB69928.1 hypothetical protein O7603_11465 [Micromonospora sp. WMMD812]
MTLALDRAVDQLYAVFRRHPRPSRMGYCAHCVAPAEVAVLLDTPLRALTGGQLRRYAGKALTTWGDLADLRYFLPRLLELLAAGAIDDPVAPGRLFDAIGKHWRGWPRDEQRAVEAYLAAWWGHTLATFPAPVEATDVLAAIGATGVDVGPYLAGWVADGGEPAARHLADHLATPLPGDGPPWVLAVRAWRAGPEPARILETAVLAASDPAVAEEISAAYEIAAPPGSVG